MKERKMVTFLLEISLFSHILIQTAAAVVLREVFLLSISLHPSDFPGLCF